MHYESLSMQYTKILSEAKIENFDVFNIFAQNINNCGYTLKLPQKQKSLMILIFFLKTLIVGTR